MEIKVFAREPMKNKEIASRNQLFLCFYLEGPVFLFWGHFENDPRLTPKSRNLE